MTSHRLDRRQLLQAAAALGAVPSWLHGLQDDARERDRVVVVVQLHGGNDGLSTIAPVADDLYHTARPDLRVTAKDGHALDDHHRWHPSLARLARRFADGGVAAVQGVGYPNPNLSHFSSLDFWHSGALVTPPGPTGWIGRLADATLAPVRAKPGPDPAYDPLSMLAIGRDVAPHAMQARLGLPVAVPSIEGAAVPIAPMDAAEAEARARREALEALERASTGSPNARTARLAAGARAARQVALDLARAEDFEHRVDWPDTKLARDLDLVARVVAHGLPTRFFFVSQDGYDTHANQAGPHARLLAELDGALDAFLGELEARALADRVLVVTMSDFGRRVRQNASGAAAGTDHGAASVQLLLGAGIEPGLHGGPPDLENLDEHGNLVHAVDFREVYAAVAAWLGAVPEAVLGAPFAPHPCLRVAVDAAGGR